MNKIDRFLFETNVKKICLFDNLMRREEFKDFSITNLKHLVDDIIIFVGNLEGNLKKCEPKIKVGDGDYWCNSDKLIDIFKINVMEFKPYFMGEIDFKEELKKRWKE